MIEVGDIVGRKSYGCDVLFRVVSINRGEKTAALRGVSARLAASAELGDLVKIEPEQRERIRQEYASLVRRQTSRLSTNLSTQRERSRRSATDEQVGLARGRVLHLDGDPEYTEECKAFYKSVGIVAKCIFVPEREQAAQVVALTNDFKANVVVITGHDGKTKGKAVKDTLNQYYNSQSFLNAVQALRVERPNRDDLAIVAGACQSYYEVLLAAGANFASSPGRILIDIFDPCIIASQIAGTTVREFVQPQTAIKATKGQAQGMGGVESEGQARVVYPTREEGDV